MRGLTLLGTSVLAANAFQFPAPSNTNVRTKPPTVEEPQFGRREALQSIFLGGVALVATNTNPKVANALDMDAFMSSELEKDQKNCNPKIDPKCMPKMSADEALCKYGQSGNARGEACKRFKASGGTLPTSSGQGKSLGGAYAI